MSCVRPHPFHLEILKDESMKERRDKLKALAPGGGIGCSVLITQSVLMGLSQRITQDRLTSSSKRLFSWLQ